MTQTLAQNLWKLIASYCPDSAILEWPPRSTDRSFADVGADRSPMRAGHHREAAPWMLVDGGAPDGASMDAPIRGHGALLSAVARRGLPNVIEATVIPATMFIVTVRAINASAAMAAVLIWTYAAILRRVVRRRKIPAILVLATLGLTVRT